jgi:hypothetical protein
MNEKPTYEFGALRFSRRVISVSQSDDASSRASTYNLRYHTIVDGKKERSIRENTCCEGQGTRLVGSLPEHIYSIAPDGLYVNLYEPSTIKWQHAGQSMELILKTRSRAIKSCLVPKCRRISRRALVRASTRSTS